MRGIKQIIRDLLTLHNGLFGIGNFTAAHCQSALQLSCPICRLSLRCPTVGTSYHKRLMMHETARCSGGCVSRKTVAAVSDLRSSAGLNCRSFPAFLGS